MRIGTRPGRIAGIVSLLFGLGVASFAVFAQTGGVEFVSPKPNEMIREKVAVVVQTPTGNRGYVIFRFGAKGDKKLRWLTAQGAPFVYNLDTKEPERLADGEYVIRAEAHNDAGLLVGTAEVTFRVANAVAMPKTVGALTDEGVVLQQWEPGQYYRREVFQYMVEGSARADATWVKPLPGDEPPDVSSLEADFIVQWRQNIKELLGEGIANIRRHLRAGTLRTRQPSKEEAGGEGGKGSSGPGVPKMGGNRGGMTGGPGGKGGGMGGMAKPVAEWTEGPFPDVNKTYAVNMKTTGEVQTPAKRSLSDRFSLGELQLVFPVTPVPVGGTWESDINVLSELSDRKPRRVRARHKFEQFEWDQNIQTAKIVSTYSLSQAEATTIAEDLMKGIGPTMGEGGGMGGPGGPGGAGMRGGGKSMGEGGEPEKAKIYDQPHPAMASGERITYFDFEKRRVLRVKDTVTLKFVTELAGEGAGGMGGGPGGAMGGGRMGGGAMPGAGGRGMGAPAMPGSSRGSQRGGQETGPGGGSGEQTEPKLADIKYTVVVNTFLDERPSPPHESYRKGANAHTVNGTPELTWEQMEKEFHQSGY